MTLDYVCISGNTWHQLASYFKTRTYKNIFQFGGGSWIEAHSILNLTLGKVSIPWRVRRSNSLYHKIKDKAKNIEKEKVNNFNSKQNKCTVVYYDCCCWFCLIIRHFTLSTQQTFWLKYFFVSNRNQTMTCQNEHNLNNPLVLFLDCFPSYVLTWNVCSLGVDSCIQLSNKQILIFVTSKRCS